MNHFLTLQFNKREKHSKDKYLVSPKVKTKMHKSLNSNDMLSIYQKTNVPTIKQIAKKLEKINKNHKQWKYFNKCKILNRPKDPYQLNNKTLTNFFPIKPILSQQNKRYFAIQNKLVLTQPRNTFHGLKKSFEVITTKPNNQIKCLNGYKKDIVKRELEDALFIPLRKNSDKSIQNIQKQTNYVQYFSNHNKIQRNNNQAKTSYQWYQNMDIPQRLFSPWNIKREYSPRTYEQLE